MSRHELVPLDRAHQVVVGWDRPLHTFFAQVLDVAADEDGDTRTVLWVGGEFGACLIPRPSLRPSDLSLRLLPTWRRRCGMTGLLRFRAWMAGTADDNLETRPKTA